MNFDFEIINEMLIPVIVIFSLILGYVLKKWIPADNKFIPTILVCVGAILGGLISGWNLESITAGMLSALASTGLHQLFYQYLKIDDASTLAHEVDYMGPGEVAETKISVDEDKNEEVITIEESEEV